MQETVFEEGVENADGPHGIKIAGGRMTDFGPVVAVFPALVVHRAPRRPPKVTTPVESAASEEGAAINEGFEAALNLLSAQTKLKKDITQMRVKCCRGKPCESWGYLFLINSQAVHTTIFTRVRFAGSSERLWGCRSKRGRYFRLRYRGQ